MDNIDLKVVSHDTGRLPNIPNGADLQTQINQLANQIQDIKNALTRRRRLMRTRNTATSVYRGPLRGPKSVLPPPITTRDHLAMATSDELDDLNGCLRGLQDYPVGESRRVRRDALALYLGVKAYQ
ncbi:hypothetical protein M413DRAFT_30647 [Hebeloma cylindrosporum]|uniref:Uncharacterized protein n=1 Tax=Hebeloma cylindrosporum TaxID=76867 RepID=A0A0C2Y9L1_HEBCY|nr:hypothetical protein M413DRAFT_30647 [Hebeloma cylindrosporum h7]